MENIMQQSSNSISDDIKTYIHRVYEPSIYICSTGLQSMLIVLGEQTPDVCLMPIWKGKYSVHNAVEFHSTVLTMD